MRWLSLLPFCALALGCGHVGTGMSPEFRTDAKYAFNLIDDVELHQSVLKTDVERAFAKLEAEANTQSERQLYRAVNGYRTFVLYGTNPKDEDRAKACKANAELLFGDTGMAKIDYPSVTENSCAKAYEESSKEIAAQIENSKKAEQAREAAQKREAERVRATILKMRKCAGDYDYDCRDQDGFVRGRVVPAAALSHPKVGLRCGIAVHDDCYDEQNIYHAKSPTSSQSH